VRPPLDPPLTTNCFKCNFNVKTAFIHHRDVVSSVISTLKYRFSFNGRSKLSFSCPCGLRYFSTLLSGKIS
jgi:hypothetical protein